MRKLSNWLLTCQNTRVQGILRNMMVCPGLTQPETDLGAMKWQYPASNMYSSVLRKGIKTRDSGIPETWLGSAAGYLRRIGSVEWGQILLS